MFAVKRFLTRRRALLLAAAATAALPFLVAATEVEDGTRCCNECACCDWAGECSRGVGTFLGWFLCCCGGCGCDWCGGLSACCGAPADEEEGSDDGGVAVSGSAASMRGAGARKSKTKAKTASAHRASQASSGLHQNATTKVGCFGRSGTQLDESLVEH